MNDELKNILSKVFLLYQKYGVKSVTMDDIAKELGISKKTLYNYVKDKRELVEKIADMKVQLSIDHQKHMKGSKLNAVEELLFVYKFLDNQLKSHNPSMMFDLKKYYPDVFKKMHEARRKISYEGMLQNMKKGQKEGFYRLDLNCEIIAKLHLFKIENLVDSDLFTQYDFQGSDIFKEMFNYHLRGIANQKGIEYFEEKLNEEKP